jgi:hypothetical protein
MTSFQYPMEGKLVDRVESINWRPIADYRKEMGAVIVWMQWPSDARRHICKECTEPRPSGLSVIACPNDVTDLGPVWCEARNHYWPLEVDGRKVTHFVEEVGP